MAYLCLESRPSTPDGKRFTPAELANGLRSIVNELYALVGSSEDEFLRLGANLNDFQMRAGEITSIAQDVVNLVTGEEIADGIKRLDLIVGSMDFFLKKALKANEQSSSTLNCVLELLENVDAPLSGFRKINKMLRMLGISTRIESTRLAEGAEGFDNLASDVQQLYVQINEKASSINNLKKELNIVIRQAIVRIKKIENEQRAEVVIMLDNALSSLCVLRESNLKCTEFASSITSSSMDVSRNIAEVVMSMQFHDITRQQIEHVAEAMTDVSSILDTGFDSGVGAGDMDGVVGEALVVLELQVAQLTHATSELSSAVMNILENLSGISGMEEAISREAKEMAGSADDAGSSFFDDMERSLTTVANALKKSADENRGLVVALQSVDGTIVEMSMFVDSIETIGEEIELIAINAQIKAARTGKDGAALGVLAEAIQRLSLGARTQTGSISSLLKSITETSVGLCGEVDNETSALEAEVLKITTDLGAMLQMLRNVNTSFVSLLKNIDRSVESLTSDIGSATSGITVHERTEASLRKAIDELTGLISLMRPLLQSSTSVASTASLEDLSGRYTMHSERKIHENIAAAKRDSDQELVIPLPPPPVEAAGDFGENVELF